MSFEEKSDNRIRGCLCAPVPPLLPRATVGDNRLALIFGFLIAYRKEFEKKLVEVAAKVSWQRACRDELDKRFGRLKEHVLPFLMLIFSETNVRLEEYQKIVDQVRPSDWRQLARQLPVHQADQTEVDSLSGLILGMESTKHEDWSVASVAFKALSGGFDFLPKRIRDRIISEIRSGKAKKRTPPGGEISLERAGAEVAAEDQEARSPESIKRAVEAATPELREAYGPKADVVVLSYLLAGGEADQTAIAQQAELSDRQVRAYLTRFKENPDPLMRLIRSL